MPRADNFPEFNLGFTCNSATSNPLELKDAGKQCNCCSPAVMNAVMNAVGTEVSMPATAEKFGKHVKK